MSESAATIEEHIANVMGVDPVSAADAADGEEAQPNAGVMVDESTQGQSTLLHTEDPPAEEPIGDSGGGVQEDLLPGDAEGEAPVSLEQRLADSENAAAGRLGEITNLRERLRQQGDELSRTRKGVEDIQQALRQQEAPVLPDGVEEDPTVRYLVDRIDKLEGTRTQTDESTKVQNEMRELNEFGMNSVQRFRAANPDWDAAYAYARDNISKTKGHKGLPDENDRVNLEELTLVHQFRSRGLDPATQMYEYAKANGYEKENGQPVEEVPEVMTQQRVRRVREGIGSGSLSEARGANPDLSGSISADQWDQSTTTAERLQVYQRHPLAFERLMKTGRIPSKFLPGR